jgi:hypothetical protein
MIVNCIDRREIALVGQSDARDRRHGDPFSPECCARSSGEGLHERRSLRVPTCAQHDAGMIPHPPTVVIEKLTPLIEGGRYPIKRTVGEDTVVEADIFKDGHDVVSAVLKWRKVGGVKWNETAMTPIPRTMDRWRGTMSVYENAVYEFTDRSVGRFLSKLAARIRNQVRGPV